MITLIAESKSMREKNEIVTHEKYIKHCPYGETVANEVMYNITHKPLSEIASEIRVSNNMASKILKLAYDFHDKHTGIESILAFNGVVFKALDFASLSSSDKTNICKSVRIISSLYGWLKPDDIIKPYRMEFNSPLAPENQTFIEYWRDIVTRQLIQELSQTGENTDIIDLLPGDAARCLDTNLIKQFTKIWKVDFKQLKEGGKYHTPNSNMLKRLRGKLLRGIITNKINSPSDLMTFSSDIFLPLGTPDYPDHIAFCV